VPEGYIHVRVINFRIVDHSATVTVGCQLIRITGCKESLEGEVLSERRTARSEHTRHEHTLNVDHEVT